MTNTAKPPAPAQPAPNTCTCAGCGTEYLKPLPIHKYEDVRLCFTCASIWENTNEQNNRSSI